MSSKRDQTRKRPASTLYQQIWRAARRIPYGRVATYGQIAALAGHPRQPRLAGYAMRHAPEGSRIPWHRVINAKGEISRRAPSILSGEENLQRVLLEREGVEFDHAGRIDLRRCQWKPRRRRSPARRS
jgi:methylated-DNA-protein-cysteine methyltransferase-like protein